MLAVEEPEVAVDRETDRFQDFIQVAATLGRIEAEVRNLTEQQRSSSSRMDQYIVEHRSQHLDDRNFTREYLDTQVKAITHGRRVYYTLLAAITGSIITDILIRLLVTQR